jgi:hypothetical protein
MSENHIVTVLGDGGSKYPLHTAPLDSCIYRVARDVEWHHCAQRVTLSSLPLTLSGVRFVPWLAVWRMQMPMTRKWTEGRLTFTLTHRWRDEPHKYCLLATQIESGKWSEMILWRDAIQNQVIGLERHYASVSSFHFLCLGTGLLKQGAFCFKLIKFCSIQSGLCAAFHDPPFVLLGIHPYTLINAVFNFPVLLRIGIFVGARLVVHSAKRNNHHRRTSV